MAQGSFFNALGISLGQRRQRRSLGVVAGPTMMSEVAMPDTRVFTWTDKEVNGLCTGPVAKSPRGDRSLRKKNLFSQLRLRPGPGRKEPSSVSTSEWTQNVARFCSSIYRRFRPALPRLSSFSACYRCVLAVRYAGRCGGYETSAPCIRSRLHLGQPQLNVKARRPPYGHGEIVSIYGRLCCRLWCFAGMGFSRVPGHRHHFVR